MDDAEQIDTGSTREEDLTDRERAVIQLVSRGMVTPEIAEELATETETVMRQVESAMMKLGARTRAHAVALAAAEGQIALVAEAPLETADSPLETRAPTPVLHLD